MKKRSWSKIAIVALFVTILASCGGEQGKFQGSWESSRSIRLGTMRIDKAHLIFTGDNWILLADGNEIYRGKFITDYKLNKDNKFIQFNVQHETFYFPNYKPFIAEISDKLEFDYTFLPKDSGKKSFEIDGVGTFIETNITSREIGRIETVFKENQNNPDIRNTALIGTWELKESNIQGMADIVEYRADNTGIMNNNLSLSFTWYSYGDVLVIIQGGVPVEYTITELNNSYITYETNLPRYGYIKSTYIKK